VEELAKWLLTLDASDITITGVVLVVCVVSGWLLMSDRIVLGSRYREVVADRDRLRTAAETCAASKETDRDATTQLRLELMQARFERDFFQRQEQSR
jgi:hypothetical protein